MRVASSSGFAAAVLAAVLSTSIAKADPAPAAAKPLAGVTVTPAAPERPRVEAYVRGFSIGHKEESLTRWHTPICPLVGGIAKPAAEAVLARITEDARQAGAPLAPEGKCQPNFYVLVSMQPRALLEAWRKRDAGLFGGVRANLADRIIATDRPVRVWHNVGEQPTDRGAFSGNPEAVGGAGGGGEVFQNSPQERGATASHIVNNVERHTQSVVMVVDGAKIPGLTLTQLADYLAMRGLTEVDDEASFADAPTILRLFETTGAERPPGLSPWDAAFLKALYSTPQGERLQKTMIADKVEKTLAR